MLQTVLRIIGWVGGLYLAWWYHFQTIYLMGTVVWLIFTNLGQRKPGQLSSYSVFNPNFERIAGTMDGDLFSTRIKEEKEQQTYNQEEVHQYFINSSKHANKMCFCGSNMKFKKCCLAKRIEQENNKRKIKYKC